MKVPGRAARLGAVIALSFMGASAHQASAEDLLPIKIGFTTTQSGPLASAVAPTLLARQMWAEEVNAHGGILGRKVELDYADDKYNPGLVGTLYSKMIDVDRVDLVIGPFGNAVLAPILPIVAQRGKLLFSTWTTTANAQSHYDRYFNMGPWGDKPEGFQGLYALLAAKHGLKRIALLSVDIEGPQVMTQQVRTIAAREGLTVVYDQKYPANTTEFSSLLRSINSADPDVIYVASAPANSIAIINQLSEIGVSDSVQMCCGGMVGLQLSSVLGKLGPKVNGLVNYALYAPVKTMQYAGTQAFFDRYSERAKKAGIDPLGYYGASFAYAQGQVLQQAIEATKSLDDQALAKYMHFAEFDTIVGKISFTPDGEWTRSGVVLLQFRGVDRSGDLAQFRTPDHQVVVAPNSMATGDLVPFAKARN